MNRNRLLDAFISNLANAIVHKVLERAIDKPEVTGFYHKEVKNSWEIAKAYREKINPSDRRFPVHDVDELKEKIAKKARAELNLRISKGYTNIDLSLVEKSIDESLRELSVV